MTQELKDKLHKIAVFTFTIIANVVFFGSTIYMAVCGDYNFPSILAWGVITTALVLIWDCAVLISFSKKCSDLFDSFVQWLKKL